MNQTNPIAVIGMAGLFPGAGNLDSFWQNIINGVDATGEVQPDRWKLDPDTMTAPDPQPDKAYSKRCCQITDFVFDPAGIDLDPQLLEALDPLYHIVLHVGREALSAIPTSSLNRKRTGVILAAIALPTDATSAFTRDVFSAALEDNLLTALAANGQPAADKLFGRSQYLANRVTGLPASILARAFDLGGGTYTLDAACASSLFSVKLACDELNAQRADTMLAGGVSRPNSLFTQVGFSQLRALSPSGRCAPFDESADGLVVGEGAGLVVLKRLADAVRDRDPIYGLIRGVGLSNDMRGNLLAPDSEGQLRAMHKAYDSCNWSPHDIELVECHGAGTPLGDLTELTSLKKLWGNSGWSRAQCPIGSVKSMVGHLLTAAGAAGMIKTLLALGRQILPPSLNFNRAPQNSPLNDGPFRVQTTSEPWQPQIAGRPRRAAVSAFGFGGINAHLLLEEWDGNSEVGNRQSERTERRTKLRGKLDQSTELPGRQFIAAEESNDHIPHSAFQLPQSNIAIVGMEASVGSTSSLRDFQELIFKGESHLAARPRQRWKGWDRVADRYLEPPSPYGGYCRDVSLETGEFHIPPNEIPDILPQQLLMLKVAAGAMNDAGLPLRLERPDMGTIIGIDFDLEATNYNIRWHPTESSDRWTGSPDGLPGDRLPPAGSASLTAAGLPPLTASRTLGALGGIVASRVAREFRLGGPSFVVSCEEAGGLKALEIGVRALRKNEAQAFLIGAVDLGGDLRNLILKSRLGAFSSRRRIRPFDEAADGTLPGEGAMAVIIKPLERALADGNRIYAVIKGIGGASGGGIDEDSPSRQAYLRSMQRCCQEAGKTAAAISLVETHGSSYPAEDDLESEALNEFFGSRQDPCAVGAVKANIGHTGAVSALASLVKTSLCLYQQILPPLINFRAPKNPLWLKENFHFPIRPQYWLRNRSDGARTALVGSLTSDGNCMHVLLEEFEYQTETGIQPELLQKIQRERQRPLGFQNFALFCVEGSSRQALIAGLDDLSHHIDRAGAVAAGTGQPATPLMIEKIARTWFLEKGIDPACEQAVTIAAGDIAGLKNWIAAAKEAIRSGRPQRLGAAGGIHYSPQPLGLAGELAFVFPGSGNHYLGMGRDVAVQWTPILRDMDTRTSKLKTQLLPECYVPWRVSWKPGWQQEAYQKIISDPHHMIFGQVVHGGLMAHLMQFFGIRPSAVIGYSLGESAGYFAMNVWPERGEMLKRMEATDLFLTELAGPCNAARRVWNIPADENVDWRVAVVNRSADAVRRIIDRYVTVRLLIVNTPAECVIGGRLKDVNAVVKDLNCEAIFLDGVVTVHCDALKPAADAYRDLHVFPTHQPEDIRFYSCALGRAYNVTSDKAANSILNQALRGFDFTATVKQAYQDGVRIFLELGPYSSCTRMIKRILHQKPHLALPACVRGEEDHYSIIKALAALIAERVPVALAALYGDAAYAPAMVEPAAAGTQEIIRITVGGILSTETGGQRTEDRSQTTEGRGQTTEDRRQKSKDREQRTDGRLQMTDDSGQSRVDKGQMTGDALREMDGDDGLPGVSSPLSELIESANEAAEKTAKAHRKFLEFSNEITRSFAETYNLQTELLQRVMDQVEDKNPKLPISDFRILNSNLETPPFTPETLDLDNPQSEIRNPQSNALYSREACLEFATGSVAKVLGPDFEMVDRYPARVRLPDEPLMLVDRILSLKGQKGSLGSGRIVTEHDVLPDAWYLDGGHAPVCIAVEAGQADLFLCAYLGIDLKVQGRRTYRLLDATVKFHRELPRPGETIRYEIDIEKFLRQGETYLFLFHFKGFIDNVPLITMTDGCAGFFTEEEVSHSGGIILTEADRQPRAGKRPANWQNLVPLKPHSYDEASIDALRTGNLARAFGDDFEGINLPDSLRLPGGRMKLIDRVIQFDPAGGRFGLGLIQAEADVQPDDWFLTCHFVDDMVMPGTLMYECCAHTLRIFLQRMGWITEKSDVFYEPLRDVPATLKCRGPVTPQTQKVLYEIEIKEIGFRPQPYVVADAYMYADGHRIVYFRDMSMQMSGTTEDEIRSLWRRRQADRKGQSIPSPRPPLFDRRHMLEFAAGLPSKAFGDPYAPYDRQRFIARLPRPPYLFIDRIVRAEPEPWVLKPAGWIEAECEVDPNAWYFKAERTPAVPISILLEIALQPCGWQAAYMGSALRSPSDLRFRNLGGSATLYDEVRPDAGTLTIKARLTSASEAADMIIEHFDFHISQDDRRIYAGSTYFGFFTREALAQQEGIRDAADRVYTPTPAEINGGIRHEFIDQAPLHPQDSMTAAAPALALPAKAIRMIDRIEIYIPDGGPAGLGFVRGSKTVDPQEWFFKAHFYQDPVCPGSLGIESFIQLLKFMARQRWPQFENSHRFGLLTQVKHNWIYRGQIIPENKRITVEAVVTDIQDSPTPLIQADGYLKVDGLPIYKMENFGVKLIPV